MSNNLLETKTVHLSDVIGNGKKYKIPSFQRDYSWQQDQWEDLWLDMVEIYEKGGIHYMWAIVLQWKEEDWYDVIDGQQRLTTLSIFIISIIQYLKKLASEWTESEKNLERAEILTRNFIWDKDASSLLYSSKLFLNENNDHFYQSNLVNFKTPIGKLTSSQTLIWECYEYFTQKIWGYFWTDGEKATIFTEKHISKKLMFIQIKVEDDLSAYTVFETLNSRRVELTTTDLLKNFLFSKVAESPNDLNYIKKEWMEIVNIISLKEFPTFLRYYINSKYDLINQKTLFTFIKNQVVQKAEVLTLLDELKNNAYIYVALSEPNDEFWKKYPNHQTISKHIEELELFWVSTVKTLLLSAWRNMSIDDFSKILKMVCVLSFRYNVIGGKDPKIMEIEYNKIAKKIESGEMKNAKQIFEEIKSKLYIEDSEFRDIFKNKKVKISKRKLIKYILIHIENHLNSENRNYLSDNATIEHILPENPSLVWEIDFWESIRESFVERLWNFVLLEPNLNKNCENKDFHTKLSEYEKSKYQVTHDLQNHYDTWNPQTIDALQSFYAKNAAAIWRVEV